MPSGSIEVICGPMFSGKTEELDRRLRRAEIARRRILCIAPDNDVRSIDPDSNNICIRNHAGNITRKAIVLPAVPETPPGIETNAEIVGIDEVQFFGHWILDAVQNLAKEGKRVICAGLDMTWEGKPFNYIGHLMAIAHQVTKLTAICTRCNQPATHSLRLIDETATVSIGGVEKYAARCFSCWLEGVR